MTPKYFLFKLQKFPHRGSGSRNEKKAAKFIFKEYQKMGFMPVIQTFKVIKNNWLVHATNFFMFVVSAVLFLIGNIPLAIILYITGLVLFFEFPFDPSIIFKYLYPAKSQNIFVEVKPKHLPKKTIVVVGHYDTARRSLGLLLMAKIFAKRKFDLINELDKKLPNLFRGPYLFSSLSLILMPLLPFLNFLPLIKTILGCFVIYNMTAPGFLTIHAALSPFVPGALDNGAGTATVMSLANYFKKNKPKTTRLIFLNNGNEENKPNGAGEFAKKMKLNKQNTYFINLDGIGSDKLSTAYGESMNCGISLFYDRELFKIVKVLKSKDEKFSPIKDAYLAVGTDAGRLVGEKHRVITTLFSQSMEGHGYPFHYHQMTDTIDKINFDTLNLARDFVIALIQEIDK